MILTTEQYDVLNRCIGGGPLDRASIVVFGNELGTASGPTHELTIQQFVESWKTTNVLKIGKGFASLNNHNLPVQSTFLQFIARFSLAVKYKDSRFFNELTREGKIALNSFILSELYKTNTAVINLRPLPQSTERMWEYENILEKEYYKLYNFKIKNPINNSWKETRVEILKDAFSLVKDSLILGSGDKHNKRAFLEKIYNIDFKEIQLDEKTQIFICKAPKIILSNYYDNFSGIKLSGLRQIYEYAVAENLI